MVADSPSPLPSTPTLQPSKSPSNHAHTAPSSPLYQLNPTSLAPIAPSHRASVSIHSYSPPNSAISTLALPQAISLLPSRPAVIFPRQKYISAKISITPMTSLLRPPSPSLVETLPRSMKDLQTLGESTARPPLRPESLVGSTTVKGGSMDHHAREYQAIIDRLRASNAEPTLDQQTAKPVRIGEGLPGEGRQRVDEIEVEWCWFCHDEYPRGEMVLQTLEKDGQQWVCGGCITQNHMRQSEGSTRWGYLDGGADGLGKVDISMVRGNLSAMS